MNIRRFISISLVCLLISGCSSREEADLKAEEKTLRSLSTEWTTSIQDQNLDKIVGNHSQDAVKFSCNSGNVIGHDALKADLEKLRADSTVLWDTYKGRIEEIEIASSGDLAYIRGTDRVNHLTPQGPVERTGKWLDIWKKVNGEWKVKVSVWNPD